MEQPIIQWMNLRDGDDWVVLLDCNVIGLSRRLHGDLCAIKKALGEIEREWERTVLRVVS